MLFGPKKRKLIDGALLAVDVETTGLKPERAQLVSVGWIPVDGRGIDLAGAQYFVLRGDTSGGVRHADVRGSRCAELYLALTAQ